MSVKGVEPVSLLLRRQQQGISFICLRKSQVCFNTKPFNLSALKKKKRKKNLETVLVVIPRNEVHNVHAILPVSYSSPTIKRATM